MGLVIAIDGPAGAGKSTIARGIARRLRFTYIDTGAMYRAVALWALRQGLDVDDAYRMEILAEHAQIELDSLGNRVLLNGEDVTAGIRVPEVSAAASRVAAVAGVRRAMVAKQRDFSTSANVVMEGRDIGTVVFPNADLKIFLDADPGERVRRRAGELGATREQTGAIRAQIAERDARDRTRVESPLAQAPDAVYLDTSQLSIEEVEEEILKIVRARLSNGKALGQDHDGEDGEDRQA